THSSSCPALCRASTFFGQHRKTWMAGTSPAMTPTSLAYQSGRALGPVTLLDDLMVHDIEDRFQPRRPRVMRELRGQHEFGLHLCDGLAVTDHLRDFVAHDDEIPLLLLEIGNAASDMHRPVARHVGVDGQPARGDVVEQHQPVLDVGEEHAGGFALTGMDL